MNSLILYSREDCHLCEVAEELLATCGPEAAYEKVDIETDLNLIRRYGVRIPVLYNQSSQTELFWPFERDDVLILAKESQ